MNSNNHHVMGNLNQVDNYLMNSNFQQQLFSDQGFADHHHQQQSLLQFTFCNDQIPDHNNHPLSSMNFESMAQFFPPAAGELLGTANGLPESNRVVMNSSSHSGTYGLLTDNMSHGCKKRKRNKDKQGEKPREVVHVRAKRGQATDSHSLAERSRREKINEKLRCLQDLVPGCYKTMGMAVMLDVIINYVRSLQNQIDFLSMKLSSASLYYDFNSDPDTLGTILQGSNVYETQELEKLMGEGCVMQPQMHASWPN